MPSSRRLAHTAFPGRSSKRPSSKSGMVPSSLISASVHGPLMDPILAKPDDESSLHHSEHSETRNEGFDGFAMSQQAREKGMFIAGHFQPGDSRGPGVFPRRVGGDPLHHAGF